MVSSSNSALIIHPPDGSYHFTKSFLFILEITVCNGDNGGGLVFENTASNRFYIRGVVSWTPTINEDKLICDPNQYSISTLVSSHRSFIRNYTDMTHTL